MAGGDLQGFDDLHGQRKVVAVVVKAGHEHRAALRAREDTRAVVEQDLHKRVCRGERVVRHGAGVSVVAARHDDEIEVAVAVGVEGLDGRGRDAKGPPLLGQSVVDAALPGVRARVALRAGGGRVVADVPTREHVGVGVAVEIGDDDEPARVLGVAYGDSVGGGEVREVFGGAVGAQQAELDRVGTEVAVGVGLVVGSVHGVVQKFLVGDDCDVVGRTKRAVRSRLDRGFADQPRSDL